MNLSFYIFPKEVLVKKKWIITIKWNEGPEFCVTKSTVVCSDHFMDSDYATGKRQGSTRGPLQSGKMLKCLREECCAVCVFCPLHKCRRKPTLHTINEIK